ncbi:hypothetical protein Tco_0770597 [Tanacetum coccineum]|uniref:Uncharacterized protein n=1 Tax=Tanacetum coccineum TaxID=301880 RepID=A0ABQ4ZFD0_9ASTR
MQDKERREDLECCRIHGKWKNAPSEMLKVLQSTLGRFMRNDTGFVSYAGREEYSLRKEITCRGRIVEVRMWGLKEGLMCWANYTQQYGSSSPCLKALTRKVFAVLLRSKVLLKKDRVFKYQEDDRVFVIPLRVKEEDKFEKP